MERKTAYDILPLIKTRWSSRAISSEKISKEDINALIEAARFAPSCFNEQPWRFIAADNEQDLLKMRSLLTESNQVWANNAPVLICVISKKTFTQNQKDNFWHLFDAGTAWGYLSLEAEKRNLVAHAMGGFSKERARKELSIPDDFDIICMIALGKPGDKNHLPDDLQKREEPADRKPIKDILFFGNFTG